MEDFKHDILTWATGSTGPRCIWWPEEIDNLADVDCVDCLKHIIAYERRQFRMYRENRGDFNNQSYD